MLHPTLNQLLLDSLRRYDKPDLFWQKVGGRWQKMPTQQFLACTAALAVALRQFGLQKGDRVALFSENRPEWHIADLAVLGLGGLNLPLYAGEVPERLQFMLGEAEARLAVVARREHFEKVRAVWPNLPKLEKVIAIEPVAADTPELRGRVVAWIQLFGRIFRKACSASLNARHRAQRQVTLPPSSTPQEPPARPKVCC